MAENMDRIKLVSDSSCDKLEIPDVDFSSVPLYVHTDEGEYIDDADLNIDNMITQMRQYKGRSYTSCPSIEDWERAFGNDEDVLAFSITSALSGSYNSAMNARAQCLERNPNRNIHVFDTLSAGAEVLLQVEMARELILAGESFDGIVDAICEYQNHTRLLFVLESLHNFAQNGRVSKIAAAAAGILNIKVVGKASDEGTLELLAKARGSGKAKAAVLEQMEGMGYSGGRVNIGYCLNESGALELKTAMTQRFGAQDISVYPMRGLCSYYAEKGGILVGFEID